MRWRSDDVEIDERWRMRAFLALVLLLAAPQMSRGDASPATPAEADATLAVCLDGLATPEDADPDCERRLLARYQALDPELSESSMGEQLFLDWAYGAWDRALAARHDGLVAEWRALIAAEVEAEGAERERGMLAAFEAAQAQWREWMTAQCWLASLANGGGYGSLDDYRCRLRLTARRWADLAEF